MPIDPATHLEWSAAIARRAARRHGLRGSSVDELIATAHLHLVELAQRFDHGYLPAGGDPDGLFRGFAARSLYTECADEAKRLLAGGLIRRRIRRRASLVHCQLLGDRSLALAAPDEPVIEQPVIEQELQTTPAIPFARPLTARQRRLAELPLGLQPPKKRKEERVGA